MADEPQKFDPTAIKAEYLAKQHNINRADYLKDGMSDQEFISEYGDKPIGGPVSTEPDTSKYIPTPESPESGDSSNLIGAGLGLVAAKAADPYIGAAYAAKYLHDKAPEYISKLGEAFNKSQSMGDKWAFGSEPGVGGVTGNMGPGGDSVTKAAQNYRMQRDLPPEVGQKFGVNRESIIVPKSVAAEEQAARLAAQNSIPGRVSQAVKASSSGLPRKILGTALPWLTFPAAGAEAWDAINKYAPDKDLLSRQNIQAGISGLGALGTLASTYPSVPTTVIGGGMGAAAPIVNKMIDMAYSQTPEQFWKPVKSGISSEELSKKLQPGYGTQKLIHKADGGPVLSYPMGGGLNYTMPGFAEGGGVASSIGKPHENQYVTSMGKHSRDFQKWAASMIPGMSDIISSSSNLPLQYYPADTEHNGAGDAMRHLLLQAQLTQKYGEFPAKAISYAHEYLAPGQPKAERAMDLSNDVLGRQIGNQAKSQADIIKMSQDAIANNKAMTLPPGEDGY